MATARAHVNVSVGPIVRPGDTLVLLSAENVTADQALRLKNQVMERLPGLADVILCASFSGAFTYRPDGE